MRAHELLYYLGAIDRKDNLTYLGKVMAEFPLEPQVCAASLLRWSLHVLTPLSVQLSKFLISSPQLECSHEILTITAMLSGTFFDIHLFNFIK